MVCSVKIVEYNTTQNRPKSNFNSLYSPLRLCDLYIENAYVLTFQDEGLFVCLMLCCVLEGMVYFNKERDREKSTAAGIVFRSSLLVFCAYVCVCVFVLKKNLN